jgi:Reverse transcriptase (RNA-dependent DNA polymerase)/Endonuclease/Exonuclease/phosphatase family
MSSIASTINQYFRSPSEVFHLSKADDNKLKVFQLNVRGISEILNFNKYRALLDQLGFKFDVIVFTEVKIKSTFPVNLYSIRGYQRFESLRDGNGGGGVIVFVRSSVKVVESFSLADRFEKVRITIDLEDKLFRLLVYYRAPVATNVKPFLEDLEYELQSSNEKTMLLGDFNFSCDSLTVRPLTHDRHSRKYNELLSSFNYSVTNNLPTRPMSGKNIDHFATNFEGKLTIENLTVEIDSKLSDHNAIISCVGCPRKPFRSQSIVTREKVIFSDLARNFPDLSNRIFELVDSDSIADFITDSLISAVKASSVKKTFVVKHDENICEWMTEKTIELICLKDKLLNKRRKKPRSQLIKDRLAKISGDLDTASKKDFVRHIQQKTETRDSKKLWKNLNHILGRKSDRGEITLKTRDGTSLTNPSEVSEQFNVFFSNCATDLMNQLQNDSSALPPSTSVKDSIFLIPPDHEEIHSIIRGLKNGSAAGHDGIGPKVLKQLASHLVPLLVHLIKVIFETGVYPSTFKLAIVTPVYKSGSKSCVDNYRPISVLSVLNKIVERVIHKRLFSFLDDHLHILYSHQFGFRPRSSTENACIELTNIISHALDEGKFATAVFMDLKKAFDIVDHRLLLGVLEQYGVRGQARELFQSYLSDRRQMVKVGTTRSKPSKISTGVVQGSCLGPLLFLLFINSIGSLRTSGRIFLFADDAVLVNIHKKADEVVPALVSDMKPVLNFLAQRKMILNSSKTNFMLFSSPHKKIDFPYSISVTEGLDIKRVSTFKYLGLHLDESLKWNEHLRHLEKKLSSTNGLLWKLRYFLPQHAKRTVFDSLFQSHVYYLVPIWGLVNCSLLKNTQVLQNRALRNVYDLPNRLNRAEMYCNHVENHLPIRGCCVLGIATYMYKSLHGNTMSNLEFPQSGIIHRRSLRNAAELRPSKARIEYGRDAISSIGPRVFNKLSEDIRSSEHIFAFKRSTLRHLQKQSFINTCFNKKFFSLSF